MSGPNTRPVGRTWYLIRCPLRHGCWPAYPTKLQVAATPELLLKHQPAAWLSGRELATAASLLMAANLGGCSAPAAPTRKNQPANEPPATTPRIPALVAPLFVHGEGRGSLGCIVVVSPVYFPEEEALQIIAEQLQAAGVEISQRNVDLPEVRLTGVPNVSWNGSEPVFVWPADTVALNVDGLDPQRKIAVEFVSTIDYLNIGGPWQMDLNQVKNYDLRQVASFIADHVRSQGDDICFVAFYHPGVLVDIRSDTWPEDNDAAKAQAVELLREQVQDFVDWLKAQGVI